MCFKKIHGDEMNYAVRFGKFSKSFTVKTALLSCLMLPRQTRGTHKKNSLQNLMPTVMVHLTNKKVAMAIGEYMSLA